MFLWSGFTKLHNHNHAKWSHEAGQVYKSAQVFHKQGKLFWQERKNMLLKKSKLLHKYEKLHIMQA